MSPSWVSCVLTFDFCDGQTRRIALDTKRARETQTAQLEALKKEHEELKKERDDLKEKAQSATTLADQLKQQLQQLQQQQQQQPQAGAPAAAAAAAAGGAAKPAAGPAAAAAQEVRSLISGLSVWFYLWLISFVLLQKRVLAGRQIADLRQKITQLGMLFSDSIRLFFLIEYNLQGRRLSCKRG